MGLVHHCGVGWCVGRVVEWAGWAHWGMSWEVHVWVYMGGCWELPLGRLGTMLGQAESLPLIAHPHNNAWGGA